MLTSLILQLQAPANAVLPATLGRAGMALLLRLIHERDAALAQQLHDAEHRKPFTVSNLVMGKRAQGALRLEMGQTGWLRFTGLTPEVSGCLQALAAEPPEMIEMDGHPLRVTGATLDPAKHAWAGQTSYQDLAAPYLLGTLPNLSNRVRLEFVSPTTFRVGERPEDGAKAMEQSGSLAQEKMHRYLPVPLPELVFGSLLDTWQKFAPIALHPDMRRFAAEAVVLSRYAVRTRGVPYVKGNGLVEKPGGTGAREKSTILNPANAEDPQAKSKNGRGGMLIGFTGEAVFAVLNRDKYWLNVLQLLAAFAFYSGVGYQTGTGLGQVRIMKEDNRQKIVAGRG